jgi:hypothetical protein
MKWAVSRPIYITSIHPTFMPPQRAPP